MVSICQWMSLFSTLLLLVASNVLAGNLRSNTTATAAAAAGDAGDDPYSRRRSSRRLNNNTDDKLRQLVSNAVIGMPTVEVVQETWLGNLSLNVTDFKCYNMSYKDIDIIKLKTSQDVYDSPSDSFQLQVSDVRFECTMGISWAYGTFDGMGTVFVMSDKNFISAQMPLDRSTAVNIDDDDEEEEEKDANKGENNDSSVQQYDACEGTIIDIADLEFEGDMSMRILNLYRGLIRRVAEDQIKATFCEMMTDEMLGYALTKVHDNLDYYCNELPTNRSDPVSLEESRRVILSSDGDVPVVRTNVTFDDESNNLIDLQNDAQASGLVALALKNLNTIFSVRKNDTNAPTGDGMDYGINTILREKVLTEDRKVAFLFGNATIAEETPLVDIQMTIFNVFISGLDTATVVSPVTPIGKKTVQAKFMWSTIIVEADLDVQILASQRGNSMFKNPNTLSPIVETIKFKGQVNNVDATISLLVPLNRTEVEALPMGYILNWELLPICIPSLLGDIHISGMDVNVGEIQAPQISGIQSEDINNIVQTSVQIGLKSFGDSILQAIPNIFQTTIRDELQNMIAGFHCSPESDEEAAAGERRLVEQREDARASREAFCINLLCAIACVCTAALAAGLTMGLLSLDPLQLLIKERAASAEEERKAARALLPIVRQHHLLLVSLLLMNALANEALPLFLDELVPGYVAVILSVTLVLFFGEIIPSAVFTGPDQIKIASRLAPLVRLVMLILSPIAYPIAKILDYVLHEENDNMYNRGELSALVRIQYEEHLASKRRRKSQINQDVKRLETKDSNCESVESYGSKRSSSMSVKPEIRSTLRALNRQLSHRDMIKSDELHIDEVSMVEGALLMGTTVATEVLTPWCKVFAVPNDMILNERNSVRIYRSGYSRIPIYERNHDDAEDNTRIVGILSARQLIVVDSQDQRFVSSLPLAVPHCVAPNTSLVDLVNMFQTGGVKGSHMALVCIRPQSANSALEKGEPLPDNAGLLGVVTLEDVLEMLIQEQIYDEYDRQERKHLNQARWAFNRWKLFVKTRRKKRGGASYQAIQTGPKMLDVVENAVTAERGETPIETSSLLEKWSRHFE